MAGYYAQRVTGEAAAYDAFGRSRVSTPYTLFDSKLIFDNRPLYWDEAEVSGGGTTTAHSAARASVTMGVTAATAGRRVRQTFQRFNYQPGKSQLILMTVVLNASGGGAGISARAGYFDDANGVFCEFSDGELAFVIRSSVSGAPVENRVAQSDWNGDKLDGSGPDGITLDPAAAQIIWFDLEWLGVGSVRCGFVVNGRFYLAHTFHHANSLGSVYMSTPNLPCRYEIANDGTGGASTLECICSTVMSEGGLQPAGQLHYHSTAGTHIDMNTANAHYFGLGLRLKSAYLGEVVDLVYASIMSTSTDDFEWLVTINPTPSAAISWGDHNSAVQLALGDGAITLSGGHEIAGGFVKAGNVSGSYSAPLDNALRLGAAIDGTLDFITLGVRPLTANADIELGMGWREIA